LSQSCSPRIRAALTTAAATLGLSFSLAQHAAAAPLPLLRITDLEATMQVPGLRVVDVDNAGQVLSYQLDGATYLWHPDTGVRVIPLPRRTSMTPNALNDQGAITGDIYRIGEYVPVPYLWHPVKGLQRLPMAEGLVRGTSMAINIHGQVAGWGSGGDNEKNHLIVGSARHPMFDPRPWQRGSSAAYAINAAGHVGGSTTAAVGCCRSAMLVGEHGRTRLLGSLAAPGERDHSQVLGLNDSDEAVGESAVGGLPHAFLWSEATGMVDLNPSIPGAVVSSGTDINAAGQVVGEWNDAVRSSTFHWDAEHGGIDLNDRLDPADPLTSRTRITNGFAKMNDRGQIVTNAYIDGEYKPVLLTPVQP